MAPQSGGDDVRRAERECNVDSPANDYWSKLIRDGAKVCRFTGSQDSAWILDDKNNLHRTEVLQIQEEWVRAKKLVPNRDGGRPTTAF